MEPLHACWADHEHSDEHPNLVFDTNRRRQATEPSPSPLHRADSHDHEANEPSPLRSTENHAHTHDHNHNHSDEHLNLMYATVRQQRPFYPPRHSSSLSSIDSDSDPDPLSPSRHRRRPRGTGRGSRMRLRVVNTTPPPPPPPPPSPECRDEEGELSSGWSASSEWSSEEESASSGSGSGSGSGEQSERVAVGKGNQSSPVKVLERANNTNFCARGLRRASIWVGNKVLALGRKVDEIGERVGIAKGGDFGVDEEDGRKVGCLGRVKSGLFGRKKGPVTLKKAKIRFPLD